MMSKINQNPRYGVVEAETISKNAASQKSPMDRGIFVLAMLLLSISLSAQISFAEKPPEKGPGWEYMRDIIMLPYDSAQLFIETYPVLEAYKKYIGQQVFFMQGSDPDESVIHNYYEIVDVISYKHFLETERQRIEIKKRRERENELREREKATQERENELREQEKELGERKKENDEKLPVLRKKEDELYNTIPKLQQDYITKNRTEYELQGIEERFLEIEKRKQIRNLSLGGQRDLREQEKNLQKEKKALLKKYDREKTLNELRAIEQKTNETKNELSETKKEITTVQLTSDEIGKKLNTTERELNELGRKSREIKEELRKIEKDLNTDDDEYKSNWTAGRIKYEIGERHYFFPCEDNSKIASCRYEIKMEDIPCFVLKHTQSMDTIYRALPTVDYAKREEYYHDQNTHRAKDKDHGVLLVGGFVKLKEDAVGQNFVFWRHSLGLDPRIGSIWECTDVSITEEKYYLEWYDESRNPPDRSNTYYPVDFEVVSLSLRNRKTPNLTNRVQYSRITQRAGLDFIPGNTTPTIASEKIFKQYDKAFKQRQQERNQLAAQEKAKRRQQLAAKYGAANADKIIAGKFEIGMSKAVCKEIASYTPPIINKTATTETWKVSHWIGATTYLYFSGDKLTRVIYQ